MNSETKSSKTRYITCPHCPPTWGKGRILQNDQFLDHALKNHNFQPFLINGSVLKCRYCNGDVIRDIGNHEKSKCIASNSNSAKIEKKHICENLGCNFQSHVFKIISAHRDDCYRKCSLCDYFWEPNMTGPRAHEYSHISKKLEKLKRHYVNVHGKYVAGVILCEICALVCYREDQYLRHKKFKHDGFKKPKEARIICEICADDLASTSKKEHMKMKHQDLSLRTCGICAEALPNRAELYKHYGKEHPKKHCPVEIDNDLVWKCKHCNDIFASQTAMFNHYRLIHKVKVSFSDMSVV